MRIEEQFAELFEGRHDAFGLDKGGCIRDTEFGETWEEIAQLHLEGRGLTPIGVYPMVKRSVGYDPKLHPVVEQRFWSEWKVKWGCVDHDVKSQRHKSFDYETEEEAHIAAVNLQRVLAALGAASWIERTLSHGRHVWVFAETWVPAATMRRALLVACQVAGVSARECNPKQESLQDGQLGNYCRLPYAGALSATDMAGRSDGGRGVLPSQQEYERESKDRNTLGYDGSRRGGAGDGCGRCGHGRVLVPAQAGTGEARSLVGRAGSEGRGGVDDDAVPASGSAAARNYSRVPGRVAVLPDGRPLCVSCFTEMASSERVSPDVLQGIAAKWKAPEAVLSVIDFPVRYEGDPLQLVSRLTATGRSVFTNGPNDGDRSRGMVYLAKQAKLSSLEPSEAAILLASAHWNKYRGRADEVKQIEDIVSRAWT